MWGLRVGELVGRSEGQLGPKQLAPHLGRDGDLLETEEAVQLSVFIGRIRRRVRVFLRGWVRPASLRAWMQGIEGSGVGAGFAGEYGHSISPLGRSMD